MNSSLLAHVPHDRRPSLASGEPLPAQVHGAALFADLAGFTPLAEVLVRSVGARRGAELLSRQINRIFEACIAQIEAWRGSVIGFSGDAVTCWFDDADGPASPRAAACALALQQTIRSIASITLPDGSSALVALKVAIASGPAERFIVGDPAIQYIDTLAGAPLLRMAIAEGLAAPNEVLIDQPTLDALGGQARVSAWRSGPAGGEQFAVLQSAPAPAQPAPWPPTPSIRDEQLRPWILPVLYQRHTASLTDMLAELRPAIALFIRFTGIEFGSDPAAAERLDLFVRQIQQILARYDGTLLQLTIGDKGSYLYTAFGAPVAHEDDARRAIAAALRVRALAEQLPFIRDIQIGISQGVALASTLGSASRQFYAVLGNQVNIAARLMSMAQPGQIVASATIAQALGAEYACQPLGEVRLKGLAEPLPLFAIDAAPRSSLSVPPSAAGELIGRTAEQALLAAQLAALQAGHGGCVVIEGDAGIGKSWLVSDLLTQARAAGVTVLHGAGEALESTRAWHGWYAIVRELLGIEPHANLAQERARLLEQLHDTPELLERAPLLNAVLMLDLPENDLTSQLTGELRLNNTCELLIELLARAARQAPTLVVIEDAHWLDSASWMLADRLRSQLPELLLVIASRPFMQYHSYVNSNLPVEIRHITEAEQTVQIKLQTLPRDAIDALICGRLGVSSVPQSVLDLIWRTAEGHPFFSEEIAYALRDSGAIQVAGGVCRVAANIPDLGQIDFPNTIQRVIISRIDQLLPIQQITLKIASVIGNIFLFRNVYDIHPINSDRAQLIDYLERLAQLELTPLHTAEPERAYEFKHVITREVAYQLLPSDQRARLHATVAQWYEQAYADRLPRYYSLLAFHYTQALEAAALAPATIEKALGYLELAALQTFAAGAYQEAVQFFQQLLLLDQRYPAAVDAARAADSGRRARWVAKIGEAQLVTGFFNEAHTNLAAGIAQYQQPLPATPARLRLQIGRELLRQIKHRLQPARIGTGLSDEQRKTLADMANIYKQISAVAYHADQKELSLYSTLRMLNLGEVAQASADAAVGYGAIGLMCGYFGQQRFANHYFRAAQQGAQQSGQLPVIGEVRLLQGMYLLGLGSWADAQANLRESLAIHQQIRHRPRMTGITLFLAQMALLRGELAEARAIALAMQRTGQHEQNPAFLIWAHTELAAYALRVGDQLDAIAQIEAIEPLIAEHAAGQAGLNCWGLLALAHWRQGQHDRAAELAEQVQQLIRLTRGIPVSYNVYLGYTAVAEIALGQLERGSSTAKAARQGTRWMHTYRRLFPIGQPAAWLYQGRLDALAGRPAKALQAWRSGLAAAERFGMPYEQAQLHHAIGQQLPSGSPQRAEQLRRARVLFERLGAAHDLGLIATSERT